MQDDEAVQVGVNVTRVLSNLLQLRKMSCVSFFLFLDLAHAAVSASAVRVKALEEALQTLLDRLGRVEVVAAVAEEKGQRLELAEKELREHKLRIASLESSLGLRSETPKSGSGSVIRKPDAALAAVSSAQMPADTPAPAAVTATASPPAMAAPIAEAVIAAVPTTTTQNATLTKPAETAAPAAKESEVESGLSASGKLSEVLATDSASSSPRLSSHKKGLPRNGTRKLPTKKVSELGAEIQIEEPQEAIEAAAVAEEKTTAPPTVSVAEDPQPPAAATAVKKGSQVTRAGFGIMPGMSEALARRSAGQIVIPDLGPPPLPPTDAKAGPPAMPPKPQVTVESLFGAGEGTHKKILRRATISNPPGARRASAPAVEVDISSIGPPPVMPGPHLLKKK